MEHVEPPMELIAGRGPLPQRPDATPGAIRYASPMKLCLAALILPAALLAQPKSLLIEDMTWTEVRDAIAAGKTTAIYYAASIEENGPGVALGKHLFIAHHTAQKIAEQLGNALVYPTMPFAPNGDPVAKNGLMEFPGTINVSEQAFGLIAHDVAMSAISAVAGRKRSSAWRPISTDCINPKASACSISPISISKRKTRCGSTCPS